MINYVDMKKTVSKKRDYKKGFITAVLSLLLILLGLGLLTFFVSRDLIKESNKTVLAFNNLKEAVKAQDITKVKNENQNLRNQLKTTQKSLAKLFIYKLIPFLGAYYSDGEHLLKGAIYGTESIDLIADSLVPFADVLGLKGGSGAGSAESYIQSVIKSMPKIAPRVDDISAKLKLTRVEIDKINTKKYPRFLKIKGVQVRKNLDQTKEQVDAIESFMPELRPILLNVPPVLGEPNEKTYLILFQNDKELRPTGGFITAYAIAKIKEGKLISIVSDDIYNLDRRLGSQEPAPTAVRDYLRVPYLYIRDTNLSPDFGESMKKFEEFYNRVPNAAKIDGIIALDTEFVRSLLEITGPVTTNVYKETFSSDVSQYGVSDVVYKLELYSEQLLAATEKRKDLIGDLMASLIQKIYVLPKNKWSPLLFTVKEMADEKHIIANLHDEKVQNILEKYNFAGRIKDYGGDYLHVNDANFAGRKANLYIKQKIEQDINIDKGGKVTKKVTVTIENPKPFDGWLNSTYYDWMRILVPAGSELISSESYSSVSKTDELGKKVFTTYTFAKPLGENRVSVTYTLPFPVKKGEEYKLLVQKQPGTLGSEVIIRLNGKQIEKFHLTVDKEIKFKI